MSDDFAGTALSGQWSYLHAQPAYILAGGTYRVPTVAIDSIGAMSNLPLLAESAPRGDFMVETKLQLNLPTAGGGADFAQGGLLLYGDNNNYVRLHLYSNNDTRQIEFIKQDDAKGGRIRNLGRNHLGPPNVTTPVTAWLRIVKANVNEEEHYTAYR